MLAVKQYLEPCTPTAMEQLRAGLDTDPLMVLRIATAIGEARGQFPPEAITEAARAVVPVLLEQDQDDIQRELTECLLTRDVDAALEWLLVVGFLGEYMPELTATRDLAQEGGRRHKDVWEHTKLVVKQAVRKPAVRWGALLHDIGKVPTRTFTKSGVHFHGHAEVGARMFDKMCRRIRFEKPMRRTIRFLIKHHLRPGQYSREWTDSAVRRFEREMHEHLDDLMALSRADITSKRPGRRKALLRQLARLDEHIERVREADALVPPLHPGIGNDIMTHFELPPSRLIGDIKRELEAAIERGELDERQGSDYYIAWLEEHGTVPRLQASRDGSRAKK